MTTRQSFFGSTKLNVTGIRNNVIEWEGYTLGIASDTKFDDLGVDGDYDGS